MAAETGVPDVRELYDRAACGLLVTAADGTIVEDASTLAVGDDVAIAFSRGTAGANIKKLRR